MNSKLKHDELGNSTDASTTAGAQLDYGVILYSCSFAVIFLMILCQARDGGL